jgi:zinc transport system substrate-binding protein
MQVMRGIKQSASATTKGLLFAVVLIDTTICVVLPWGVFQVHTVLATNSHVSNNIAKDPSNNTLRLNPLSQSKISVVASFFPIYEFTKAVGGDRIDLSSLIPFGSEPHGFDPTIQDIQKADSANLLVYNGASMEEPWIHSLTPQNTVDTSKGINLLANQNNQDIKGPNDPHIWLNPVLAIHQVQNIRDGLDKIDSKNAAYYNQNAQIFIGQLNKLDAAFKVNLANSNCAKRDFISFHQAFEYLAPQYGLTNHPIHQGLTPNGEVLPQKLIETVNLANKLGLKVIYSEDLIDPRSSQAIAEQIPGSKVLVLSPIEGIKSEEQKSGIGYLDKMYQDLAALKVGLQCKT